jgi:hypothetical protein
LQIESCRQLLKGGELGAVEGELSDLQHAINREHDEMRFYVRSLAAVGPPAPAGDAGPETHFSMQVNVEGSGVLLDNVLNIIREGVTNIRRHSSAGSASIVVNTCRADLTIAIDDNGQGFGDTPEPPWSIAARVRQLGGMLRVLHDEGPGAHLIISLPRG